MIKLTKQVLFSYTMEGSLEDTRGYLPYTLVGPPVWRPVLSPLAVYTSTTVYINTLALPIGFAAYKNIKNLVNIKKLWKPVILTCKLVCYFGPQLIVYPIFFSRTCWKTKISFKIRASEIWICGNSISPL